jgi:hypothetical protein
MAPMTNSNAPGSEPGKPAVTSGPGNNPGLSVPTAPSAATTPASANSGSRNSQGTWLRRLTEAPLQDARDAARQPADHRQIDQRNQKRGRQHEDQRDRQTAP